MDNDDGQVKFWKQYIQRQEILLLDYIRKTLELEIKVLGLNTSLHEYTEKYEESQKQVAIQNELMQQAATGVESFTVEKKAFEQKELDYKNSIEKLNKNIDDLKKSLHDCKTEREEITRKHNEMCSNVSGSDKRYNDLLEEYRRQTEELNKLFQENQELKSKQPINKRKPKQAILPPDEF